MAAEKLDWGTKIVDKGQTASGRFFATEANDLQEKFNANADILDALTIAGKTPIPITVTLGQEFTIPNWQTNLVENDPLERTYAERFGNNIKLITNRYDTPLGHTTAPVENYVEYDEDELLIQSVTFPANVLNTGFINIL